MQPTQRIGFDESTIVGIHNEFGSAIIELDGVHFDENLRTASVRMTGIKTTTRDGMPIAELPVECEEAEVLTLQYTDKVLQLIVECTDFEKHRSETHPYRITCDPIKLYAG